MSPKDVPTSLEELPTEILDDVLDSFSTKDLLPLAPVSRRFCLLITSLLHRRLLDVSSLPQNDLIFECYHPSAKISTPYLACHYIGTKTRGEDIVTDKSCPALPDLRRLYSCFRPAIAEENRRCRTKLCEDSPVDDTATEDIYLDEGELFSQLCTATNLVKTGPRKGLFLSLVNISDSTVRVRRNWLADTAVVARGSKQDPWSHGILWADESQNVGIRFSVTPGPIETMPVLSGPDDCPPVAYRLQYEELLVRTRKLLLAAEKSVVQDITHSGKAIVIVSF
ncbi:hypothetical protein ACO1O0_003083 [Amphichorda felina]